MRIITSILQELSRPDNQKLDWYGWVTNQTGHFTIGVILTSIALQLLPIHFALLPALVFAGLKESLDMIRGGSFKDSFVDWVFQIVGGFFCIVLFLKNFDLVNLSIVFIVVSLVFGLIPRVRKAFQKIN